MSLSSLSIMFPFLNDWGTVGSLVALAVETAKKYTDDWEVIIVDDGSTEVNREALEMIVNQFELRITNYELRKSTSYQRPRPKDDRPLAETTNDQRHIRIIHHEKNRGYGGALRSGFSQCTKDFIFYTDCDAQYDPRELSNLIEAYLSHSAEVFDPEASDRRASRDDSFRIGMVNGYKIKRHDPWYRIVAGRLYHHIVKIAFRLPIADTDCDFRLIRRNALEQVKLFENTGTICVELVKKIDHAGYMISEVPVHHYWRTSGKSQFFNFMRLYKTAINLGRLWWTLIVKREYGK